VSAHQLSTLDPIKKNYTKGLWVCLKSILQPLKTCWLPKIGSGHLY